MNSANRSVTCWQREQPPMPGPALVGRPLQSGGGLGFSVLSDITCLGLRPAQSKRELEILMSSGDFRGARLDPGGAVCLEINEANGVGMTGLLAGRLGLAVLCTPLGAKIAFGGYAVVGAPVFDWPRDNRYDAERTNHGAELAPDTTLLIDVNRTKSFGLDHSSGGTDLGAGRILALATLHGNVRPLDGHHMSSADQPLEAHRADGVIGIAMRNGA